MTLDSIRNSCDVWYQIIPWPLSTRHIPSFHFRVVWYRWEQVQGANWLVWSVQGKVINSLIPLIPPKHFISLHLLFSIHYWHLSVLKYIYLTWFVFHCTYPHQMSIMKTFFNTAIFVIKLFFWTMLAYCAKLSLLCVQSRLKDSLSVLVQLVDFKIRERCSGILSERERSIQLKVLLVAKVNKDMSK